MYDLASHFSRACSYIYAKHYHHTCEVLLLFNIIEHFLILLYVCKALLLFIIVSYYFPFHARNIVTNLLFTHVILLLKQVLFFIRKEVGGGQKTSEEK